MARREFLIACLAGLLYSVTQNYSALLAVVFAASGHALPAIGLLLSLFAVPALVGTLASSAIVARIGVLPAVRCAALCTAAGIGSLAVTRSDFSLALASRLVQGFGVGLLLPALMTYVQSRLDRARFVYLVTAFSAVIPLAAAIAPPLGEWTFERYGARALFVEAAIPALLCCALTFLLRPMARPRAQRSRTFGRAAAAVHSAGHGRRDGRRPLWLHHFLSRPGSAGARHWARGLFRPLDGGDARQPFRGDAAAAGLASGLARRRRARSSRRSASALRRSPPRRPLPHSPGWRSAPATA